MTGILMSYHYLGNINMQRLASALADVDIPLMLDSGAFSAHNIGAVISLEEYIEYCKGHGSIFEIQVALDVIGDGKTSKRNLDVMLDAGLKPMPVFTVDESESEENIDWFLQRSRSIGIAGNPTAAERSWSIGNSKTFEEARIAYEKRMELIYRQADEKVWLHGLSFTHSVLPWRSRCSSVDSSSWCSSMRYAMNTSFFHPSRGVKIVPIRHELKTRKSMMKSPWTGFLARCGLSWYDLMPDEPKSPFRIRDILTALAWVNYGLASRRYDLQMFMALSSPISIAAVAIACHARRPDGTMDGQKAKERSDFLNGIRREHLRLYAEIAKDMSLWMSGWRPKMAERVR